MTSARVAIPFHCIGGRNEVTNLDLVHLICDTLDRMFGVDSSLGDQFSRCPAANGGRCQGLIRFVQDRPGHDLRYAIDDAKLTKALGDFNLVTLEDGLEKTLRAYIAQYALGGSFALGKAKA